MKIYIIRFASSREQGSLVEKKAKYKILTTGSFVTRVKRALDLVDIIKYNSRPKKLNHMFTFFQTFVIFLR